MKKYLLFIPFAFSLSACSSGNDKEVSASGTLEAIEVTVSAKVGGELIHLSITEGSIVRANDTLAVLDRSTLEIQMQQAEAGVKIAEAQHRLLVNGARLEDIEQAREAVRQAESAYSSAKTDFERMRELIASKSVSQKQFDDAEARNTISAAQLNSARQNQEKLKKFARPEDLSAAAARIEQAKAGAALVRKQWKDAVILSPSAGTVTHQPVEEGELVNPGMAVATIARLEKMKLMIYVNEIELGRIKSGSPADITIDAFPEKKFPAKVIYISPVAEFTPKNVQTKDDRTKLVFGVKLEVENRDGYLKAGMPADAIIR